METTYRSRRSAGPDGSSECWVVEDMRDPQETVAHVPMPDRGRVITIYVGKNAQEVAESVADALNNEVGK